MDSRKQSGHNSLKKKAKNNRDQKFAPEPENLMEGPGGKGDSMAQWKSRHSFHSVVAGLNPCTDISMYIIDPVSAKSSGYMRD